MSDAPLSIASISTTATNGLLARQSLAWLDAAGYEIQFARDPQTLGSEPHLRMDVDPCGLDDDALSALDHAVWTEIAAREEAARSLSAANALPMAA